MSAFQITPEAQSDLIEIWEYIADDNIDAADKVARELREAFQKLADMPGMGHYRSELLDRRYRFWAVYSYVIAYRWEVQPIQIIAIVHGARDLDAFFDQRA